MNRLSYVLVFMTFLSACFAAPPSDVVATYGEYEDQVIISWASSGAGTFYRVYRYDESGNEYNSSWVENTSYVDAGIEDGEVYKYGVKAEDGVMSSYVYGCSGVTQGQYESGNLTLLTGGDANWVGQCLNDGVPGCFVSGRIDHNQSTYLETTVNSPGTISFEWRASCDDWDEIRFYVNGAKTATRYRDSWEVQEIYIDGDGGKLLRWEYVKDNDGVVDGFDCAWVRSITWEPEQSEPLDPPSGLSASQGTALNCVELAWSEVPGATHYRVYRYDDGDGIVPISDWADSLNDVDWGVKAWEENSYYICAACSSYGRLKSDLSAPAVGYAAGTLTNDSFACALPVCFELGGSTNSYTFFATYEDDEPPHAAEGGTNSIWYSWTATADENVLFEALGDTNLVDDAVVIAVYTNIISGCTNSECSIDSLVQVASATSNEWASISFDAVSNATYFIALANEQFIGSPVNLRWQVDDWVCGTPTNVVAGDATVFEGIRVSWNAVAGANYYEVWRSSSLRPGAPMTKMGGTSTLEFIDESALKLNTPYYYYVRAACDADGWLVGDFAGPVTGRAGTRPANDNIISAWSATGCYGSDSGNNLLASVETIEPEYGTLTGVDGSIWWSWNTQTNGLHTFDTDGSDASANLVLAVYTNGIDGLSLVGITSKSDADFAQVTVDAIIGLEYMIAVAHIGGGGEVLLNWNLNKAAPSWVDASDCTFFDGVLIEWPPVEGATHYQVSRTDITGSDLTAISGWITTTNFVDWTGTIGQEYIYYVRAAVDAEGWLASAYSFGDSGMTGYWPDNDDVINAFSMAGESGSDFGSLYWSTLETGEPQHGGFSDLEGSIWWSLTAPYDGTAVIDTQSGTLSNIVLSVYTNTPAGMVLVDCDDGAGSQVSAVTVSIEESVEYLVSLSTRDEDASAPVSLNWSLEPDAPPEPPQSSQITSAQIEGGLYRVSFTAQEGAVYEVVGSEQLGSGADWQPLSPPLTVTAGADGNVQLDIPLSGDKPSMFYKIIGSWQ